MLTGSMATVTGRRGRGAGFYCEECDQTYKDNLQWVDHLNSKFHLLNIARSASQNNTSSTAGADSGTVGEVKRATLEDVRERLKYLKEKMEREKEERERLLLGTEGDGDGIGNGGTGLLQERLKMRREEMEQERMQRNEKRREARRNKRRLLNDQPGTGGDMDDEILGGGVGVGKGGVKSERNRDGDVKMNMNEDGNGELDMNMDMARMMGFQGFGSTKA